MEDDFFDKKLYEILGQNIDIPNSITNLILAFEYREKEKVKIKVNRKIAIVFSLLFVSLNLVTYGLKMNDIYKAESSVGYVNSSLQQAIENGYIQNVDMEYKFSNNIGAKVDYIIMSENNLNILFNFDISKKYNIANTRADIEDLLIYDENNNIIYCYNYKTYKKFCKKNNIKYKKDEINQYENKFGIQNIETSSEINKILYTITTTKSFPKSKKLYMEFNTIYFDIERSNKIKGKWNIELNLEPQFYNREDITYNLANKSDDIELISAKATQTAMRITYKTKNIDITQANSISMYIEDNFGNRYDVNNVEDSIFIYEDEISATFPITTKNEVKYLILYISVDKEECIELVLEKKK